MKEWGDHVEIVCMRELFSCNFEVYDKDNLETPRPLGLGGESAFDQLFCVELD
jgi:hypothetical protein